MRKLGLSELGRISVEEYASTRKIDLVVICDNVRSALNVGSIFRTGDAFAVKEILLCGITSTPPNREITKTAIGATESVQWSYYEHIEDAIRYVKDGGFEVYAIEQTDASHELMQFQLVNNKIAVIFGNEVDGVSDMALSLVDGAIEVSQFGTKHSLNIAVCAGIVMHRLSVLMRN